MGYWGHSSASVIQKPADPSFAFLEQGVFYFEYYTPEGWLFFETAVAALNLVHLGDKTKLEQT